MDDLTAAAGPISAPYGAPRKAPYRTVRRLTQEYGALTVVVVLAGLLAGCGDDDNRPSTPTGPTTPTVTVPSNRAPQTSQSISDQTVFLGEDVQLDMQSYFSDPDGDTLTYDATSSNTHVATVSVAGSTVTVSTMNLGRANVRVTARDPAGLTATQSFSVTGERRPNRAPQASRSVPDQTLKLDEDETASIDLNRYFTDPDDDALTYDATSSNTHVATVSVSGSTVALTARHLGRADVRVTARDPDGLTATQGFSVTVEQGGPALEAEVTKCEPEGSSRIRIEGYVRAVRQLLDVRATGYVNSEFFGEVGTVDLGNIQAGRRENFRIVGASPIPLVAVSTCGVNVRYREAASGTSASAVLSLE